MPGKPECSYINGENNCRGSQMWLNKERTCSDFLRKRYAHSGLSVNMFAFFKGNLIDSVSTPIPPQSLLEKWHLGRLKFMSCVSFAVKEAILI